MTICQQIIDEMTALKNEEQMKNLMRFFKTGKGEYGEGDLFLGLKNPQSREFVKKYYKDVPLTEIETLLRHPYHEIRFCGFMILVEQFLKLIPKKGFANDIDRMSQRDQIMQIYLNNSTFCNNWDLVDLSAPKLLGKWYFLESSVSQIEKEAIVERYSHSANLWQRRISMVFTWSTTREKHPEIALRQALIHLPDKHDLMQKAVGWMLREVGSVCSKDILREFLEDNYSRMSRTTLRYAIEKLDANERKYWLER